MPGTMARIRLPIRWSRGHSAAVLLLLAAATLLLGMALHPLAVDDAFITYRYARNLAAGNGFVYNVGRPVLSTTAPLYGLVLAAAALVWPNLPAVANALSALALGVGAALIFVLGTREKTPGVGALAALLFVLYPLLWLSLGLETAVFLALALGAIVAYRSRRLYRTAVLLALATLTRGDGLVLTALLAADYLLRWLAQRLQGQPSSDIPQRPGAERGCSCLPAGAPSWLEALGAAGIYAALLLPASLGLAWQFGSPLPATLGAKAAQAELGITGFYAHTTYLQGLCILLTARLAQSALYLLFVPAIVAGLIAMWWWAPWVRLVVAWGAAHVAGYTILGVTPYYWYYAPLAPAVACTAALGIVASTRWLVRSEWLRGRVGQIVAWGAGGLWLAGLLVALAGSDWAMVQALDGPVPPPEDPVSKVLPEAKVDVYREVGQWLADRTPASALVGVTEVGVMGYHANRPMVDFLGLLEPEVAGALGRGDLYWALLRYQPDYLALTAISPLYAYDLRADPWFQAAYAPVQTIADPRFWGSPVTVYERQVARTSLIEPTGRGLPEGVTRLDMDLGEIRLLGALAGEGAAQPGDVLALTLYWQALGMMPQDYTVFVHLLGEHGRVIAQRDAALVPGGLPTDQWSPGEIRADPYLLALPETAYAPDDAVWEVGLYDARTGQRLQTQGGSDNVRFGAVTIVPGSEPLHLDFGPAVLTGYDVDRLSLAPGEPLELRLYWDASTGVMSPVQVTAQLMGQSGSLAASASHLVEVPPPSGDVYPLTVGGSVPAGAYDLEVIVVDPVTGQALPLLGPDGQPRSDRVRLTKVRVYPRD